MRSKRILFPNNDFKYKMWAEELTKLGFLPIVNKKKYPNYFFLLFRLLATGNTVDVVVFRYLNDRKSFLKTISNATAEFFIIVLCKLFRIQIIWIMHNVDKESIVHFPRLNRIRRNLVIRNAQRVLVTDFLLINYAVKEGVSKSRLDWVSFGLRPNEHYPESNDAIFSELRAFKQKISDSGRKSMRMGICVSSAMSKFNHFLLADDFISRANDKGDTGIGLLLIGKFPKGDKFAAAEAKVQTNPNILHINRNEVVNLDHFTNDVDFFYRSLDDLSISYSVFDAAKCQKPIFTHNDGLLPELVSHYGLGFVIPEESKGLNHWLQSSIDNWDSHSAEKFLAERTWKKGAKMLVKGIED